MVYTHPPHSAVSVWRLFFKAALGRVVLPALKETPERSVKRERLTPFWSDSSRSGQVGCWRSGTQVPSILFLCFRSLSSLVGGSPLGTSALRLAEGEEVIRRLQKESVSLLPLSPENSVTWSWLTLRGCWAVSPLMLQKWPCLWHRMCLDGVTYLSDTSCLLCPARRQPREGLRFWGG